MDYSSQKAVRCCAYFSRQHLRARLFSVCCCLRPNYSSQEAFARSDLEVGSLEVTRATGAGSVSSKRCWVGLRGLAALGVGSRDAQVCVSGCRGGLAQGRRGIGVPQDPEGQRGRTAGCGLRLLEAAALGLAPAGPGHSRTRMAQLSRLVTQSCAKERGSGSRVAVDSCLASATLKLRCRETSPNLSFRADPQFTFSLKRGKTSVCVLLGILLRC